MTQTPVLRDEMRTIRKQNHLPLLVSSAVLEIVFNLHTLVCSTGSGPTLKIGQCTSPHSRPTFGNRICKAPNMRFERATCLCRFRLSLRPLRSDYKVLAASGPGLRITCTYAISGRLAPSGLYESVLLATADELPPAPTTNSLAPF